MFEIKNLKIGVGWEVFNSQVGFFTFPRRRAIGWLASCDLVELLSGKLELSISEHYDLHLSKEEVHRQFMEHVQERCKTLYSELTQLVLASLQEEGRWDVEAWSPSYISPTMSKLEVRDTKTDTLWTVTKDSYSFGAGHSTTVYRLEKPFGIPADEQNVVCQALFAWWERVQEQAAKQKQEAGYNDLLKLYKQEGKDEA